MAGAVQLVPTVATIYYTILCTGADPTDEEVIKSRLNNREEYAFYSQNSPDFTLEIVSH